MRRRSLHRSRKRRRFTRRRNTRQKRGGFRYAEPSNPITGGGGLDTRYTFSQPLADIYRSGTHGVSNLFNSFMGRSHSVSPNVSDQPYLA